MPVLRSQTVYLCISHSCFLSLALSQQHTLFLSHVPCFVSASRCSSSLMCLALSLMSQHHVAAQPEHHAALIFMCLALSQYCFLVCFVSASLTPFLLSLMCLSCLVTVLALSCALLCLNITPLLRCLRVSRCSCSLMCLALSCSASRCSVKCFASASRRSCALPCLSMTSHRSSVLCIFQATRSIAPRCCKVVSLVKYWTVQ